MYHDIALNSTSNVLLHTSYAYHTWNKPDIIIYNKKRNCIFDIVLFDILQT